MSNHTAIELEACLNDPQELLISAFQKRNLEQFHYALTKNANPEVIIQNTKLSIFDKACQTEGCHQYINACLNEGCDVNKLNEEMQKRPINFAIESLDSRNVAELLNKPEIDVDFQWNTLTPIHNIIKHLDDDNFKEVFESVKLLIKHNANVNIPDRKMISPIITAAKKKVKGVDQIIKYLLENTNVDIDSHRDGEARKLITKLFPNLSLPIRKEKVIDFYHLMGLIKEKKEDEFKRDLEEFMSTSDHRDNKTNIFFEDDGDKTMLQLSVQLGLFETVKAILDAGGNVNHGKPKSFPPIGLACLYGNWEVLEYLQNQKDIKFQNVSDPLLCIIVKKLGEDSQDRFCDYNKCFDLILKSPKIDVNEKDFAGCTALHYAVKYKNDEAILKLLQRSAYIGTLSRFQDLPISDINPKVLEQYFDSCITTNNLRPGDESYEIIFDYTCLNPNTKPKNIDSKLTSILNRHLEEMTPIEYMTKTSELRYLIKHPLISSFLWLKWHRLGMIFYTNFLLYSLFCVSFISYVVCCYCYEHDVSQTLATILYTLSVLGVIYVTLRELIQFLMSPANYFKTLENYLELILVIVSIVVLFCNGLHKDDQRNLAAIAILLVAAEFSLLVGSLPIMSISTHMVMLKTVSISFMKSLMLYSIIIISFALSFYKLIGGQAIKSPSDSDNEAGEIKAPAENDKSANGGDDEPFNKFLDPGTALIKTIVMLTGEFEAANIDFENSFTSYIIFLLFVFFISIVLLNLLNGLAVNDTQTIKSEAELTGFIYRAELLSRYEKIILGKCLHKFKSINPISLFPDFLPMSQIILMPNENNKVYIPQPSTLSMKCNSEERLIEIPDKTCDRNLLNPPMIPLICCFCNKRCSRMDGKILKYARAVLENKNQNEEIEKEKHEMKKRICRIEEKVDSMEEILREILEKFK